VRGNIDGRISGGAGIAAGPPTEGGLKEVWVRSGCPSLPPDMTAWVAVQLVAAMAMTKQHWFYDGQQKSSQASTAATDIPAVFPRGRS